MEMMQHILDLNQAIRPLTDQIEIFAKISFSVVAAYVKSFR